MSGKKYAWLKKGLRMNENRFAKRVVVATGFLLLCVAPELSRAQGSPPSGPPPPPMAPPAARPRENTPPPDYFAGLNLTVDQKAKIDQIHQTTKSRFDAVAKDTKLSPEAKDAMLLGYRRMENNEIFNVLTPEQQKVVRQRVLAHREAVAKEQQQQPRQARQ